VTKRFWLALGNLRPRLRDPDGQCETDVLFKSGDRYFPDSHVIGCDLWSFQRHLAAAANATHPTDIVTALGRAISAYGGDFAEGLDYLWSEAVREDIRQRALDAHLRLAELEEASDHAQDALDVLERAVEISGSAEEPSRRLMILQNRLDRPDAVASTWRGLQRRLADLDLDPDPETVCLYRQLIGH
jgi:DNA-binding SARP family transcriptional activator